MIPKLPLHSPRWRDLHGVTADEVKALLEQMASPAVTGTGDEWRKTWSYMTDGLLDNGTVFDGAYAALPHLVEAAAALPPGQSVDFWVDLGFIVTAEDRHPVPADLDAGFSAALRLAERAAVRSLLAVGAPATVCASLALCCVAFAGHHTGAALSGLEPQEGYLLLFCPGCGTDTEMPTFFVDPVSPPFEAPELPDPALVRQGDHPWGAVAAALQEEALGEEWEPFLRVARTAATAGVPAETPGQAVLCLVAGMVAVMGTPHGDGGNGLANYCCSPDTSAAGTASGPGRSLTAWRRTRTARTLTTRWSRRRPPLGRLPRRSRRRTRQLQRRPGTGRTGTLCSRPTAQPGAGYPCSRIPRPVHPGVSTHWRWYPAPVSRRSWPGPGPGPGAWCACGTWPTADSSMNRCQDILTVSAR